MMTGCCIQDCGNKGEDGHYMKRFPTNPRQKAVWLQNMEETIGDLNNIQRFVR